MTVAWWVWLLIALGGVGIGVVLVVAGFMLGLTAIARAVWRSK